MQNITAKKQWKENSELVHMTDTTQRSSSSYLVKLVQKHAIQTKLIQVTFIATIMEQGSEDLTS